MEHSIHTTSSFEEQGDDDESLGEYYDDESIGNELAVFESTLMGMDVPTDNFEDNYDNYQEEQIHKEKENDDDESVVEDHGDDDSFPSELAAFESMLVGMDVPMDSFEEEYDNDKEDRIRNLRSEIEKDIRDVTDMERQVLDEL